MVITSVLRDLLALYIIFRTLYSLVSIISTVRLVFGLYSTYNRIIWKILKPVCLIETIHIGKIFFGYFSAVKFLENDGLFVNVFIDIEIFIHR